MKILCDRAAAGRAGRGLAAPLTGRPAGGYWAGAVSSDRRSSMRGVGLLAVVVGLVAGADEPGQGEARRDLDALQGRWAMVSFEVNGEAVPPEQVKAGRLVVEGDRYTPELGDRRTTFS